jgi:hypothetical protein
MKCEKIKVFVTRYSAMITKLKIRNLFLTLKLTNISSIILFILNIYSHHSPWLTRWSFLRRKYIFIQVKFHDFWFSLFSLYSKFVNNMLIVIESTLISTLLIIIIIIIIISIITIDVNLSVKVSIWVVLYYTSKRWWLFVINILV